MISGLVKKRSDRIYLPNGRGTFVRFVLDLGEGNT